MTDRRPRPGEHRLLRQPAVHRLPAHVRQQPDPRRSCSRDGKPVVDTARSTGMCRSNDSGEIVIPNLGPNRYAATVSPPPTGGSAGCRPPRSRAATTTTSGSRRARPASTPSRPRAPSWCRTCTSASSAPRAAPAAATAPTGEIKGVAVAGLPYVGGQNGQVVPETGFAGAKVGGPINEPVDRAVRPRRRRRRSSTSAAATPTAASTSRTCRTAPTADRLGRRPGLHPVDASRSRCTTARWSTSATRCSSAGSPTSTARSSSTTTATASGTPARAACPQFALTLRERDNSLMDQDRTPSPPTSTGHYDIREALPAEPVAGPRGLQHPLPDAPASPYQADNEPTADHAARARPSTSTCSTIIGLGGRIDWGVQPLRRRHQRRHRRHRHLRHDPQRARPGGRRHRGLPAGRPRHPGAPVRTRWPATTTPRAAQCRRLGTSSTPTHRRPAQGARDPGRLHLGDVGAAARLHRADVQRPARSPTSRPCRRSATTQLQVRRGPDDGLPGRCRRQDGRTASARRSTATTASAPPSSNL